jgi:4-diphosphocytidyl-2-C-methyl-D-erythritol kinase
VTLATIRETAYAKINLALHVRARRDDGYHDLETLFAFVDGGDELILTPADGISLTVTGPFGQGLVADSDNLVLQAVEAVRVAYGVQGGAAIQLIKNLPVAAGVGGGSADAAAAIRLVTRHWGIPALATGIAERLGADVPACIASLIVRGEGTGTDLIAVDGARCADLPVLLVNPGVPCPTGPVFKGWDGVDRGPLKAGDALSAALTGRNDLEQSAKVIVPEIGPLLAKLQAQDGVLLARMSGSGATCFALFETDAARDRAAAHLTEFWTLAGNLRC